MNYQHSMEWFWEALMIKSMIFVSPLCPRWHKFLWPNGLNELDRSVYKYLLERWYLKADGLGLIWFTLFLQSSSTFVWDTRLYIANKETLSSFVEINLFWGSINDMRDRDQQADNWCATETIYNHDFLTSLSLYLLGFVIIHRSLTFCDVWILHNVCK